MTSHDLPALLELLDLLDTDPDLAALTQWVNKAQGEARQARQRALDDVITAAIEVAGAR